MNTQLLTIKAKIFGVRLTVFRQKKGVSIESLSILTGIPKNDLETIESGNSTISLPMIELIAVKLGVNPEIFLNGKMEDEIDSPNNEIFYNQYTGLRNRMIALILRKTRTEQEKSLDSVAEKCNVNVKELEQYESGSISIPWPILECLAEEYQVPINSLLSSNKLKENPVEQKNTKDENTYQLNDELSNFVQNPSNMPYLDLAKKLSELDAVKLRSIAEGLLEITY